MVKPHCEVETPWATTSREAGRCGDPAKVGVAWGSRGEVMEGVNEAGDCMYDEGVAMATKVVLELPSPVPIRAYEVLITNCGGVALLLSLDSWLLAGDP